MGGSAPAAPQPYGTPEQNAAEQFKWNLEAGKTSQAGSLVNQYNPFGSITYQQTGTGPNGVPIYSATTKLNPEQQAILDALQGQGRSLLQNANYGAQDPASVIGDATSGNTQALMQKFSDYMNPTYDRQFNQLDAQLRNQGFKPGDPGYESAMNPLRLAQNQSTSGFLSQIEPQAYQQAMQNYLMPLQTASGLLGLENPGLVSSGAVQTPQLNVGAPDLTSMINAYQNQQMAAYNAQMQQYQAKQSGMWGIPTAILGGWARSGFAV